MLHSSSRTTWAEIDWIRERLQAGLEFLRLAHRYAALDDSPIEQFAVKNDALSEQGFSDCDLQWLLKQSFVDHLIELTLPGDAARSFRSGGAAIGRASCFTLTRHGVLFADQIMGSASSQHPAASKLASDISPLPQLGPDSGSGPFSSADARPCWDADRQELRFQQRLIKRFRLPSPNQAAVLSAFQEEDWPPRIDDPLPPKASQDPKRRLHDTIRNLNRSQQRNLLRFVGDGSGQGVIWETTTNS